MLKIADDVKGKDWMEFLPSAGWMVFMVIPLLLQVPFPGMWLHTGCAILVLIIFAASDYVSAKNGVVSSGKLARSRRTQPDSPRFAFFMAALLSCVVVVKALAMPKIPLFLFLSGDADDAVRLAEYRAIATKYLPGPYWLPYLFNYANTLFAPLAVVIFMLNRRFLIASAVVLVAVFNSILALEKLPVVFILFAILISYAFSHRNFHAKVQKAFVLFLFLIIPCVIYAQSSVRSPDVEVGKSLNAGPLFSPEDPRSFDTINNKLEFLNRAKVAKGYYADLRPVRTLKYLINRMFLVPSDVSMRWYQYYSARGRTLGWASVFGRGELSPSRVVGGWAYAAKFPESYFGFTNAYASFDADAYARGGVPGVMLAALLLAVLRLSAAFLRVGTIISSSAYGILLAMLFSLPMQASVQAILFAQGFFALVLVMVYARLAVRPGEAGSYSFLGPDYARESGHRK